MGEAALLSGLFLLALPMLLIFGLTWVSVTISPWLEPAFFWTLVISIFKPRGLNRRQLVNAT